MITIQKQKIQGLIINNTSYKEDSLKVTILTKNGLFDYIVKAGKRINSKLRPLAQELTFVEIVTTSNKTLNTLTEGVVLENYTLIKEDTNKLLSALAIIEYGKVFINSFNDVEHVYNFILEMLNILKKTNYYHAGLLIFETKLLYAVGTGPNFSTCCKCGGNDAYYLDVALGGAVCKNCLTNTSYNQEITKLFSLMYFIKLKNINEDFLQLIDKYSSILYQITKEYYATHFDYVNKNHDLLIEISKDN